MLPHFENYNVVGECSSLTQKIKFFFLISYFTFQATQQIYKREKQKQTNKNNKIVKAQSSEYKWPRPVLSHTLSFSATAQPLAAPRGREWRGP